MATKSQLQDLELYDHISRCIDEGRLPVHLPERVSAGYGFGSKCHACDQSLTHREIEYSVEDPRNAAAPLSLHLGCYVIWQIECVKRLRKQQQDRANSQPATSTKSSPIAAGENERGTPATRHT